VPVRQWVLSLPIPLRVLFAAQPQLLTPVLEIILRVIAGFLAKIARLKRNMKPYCWAKLNLLSQP